MAYDFKTVVKEIPKARQNGLNEKAASGCPGRYCSIFNSGHGTEKPTGNDRGLKHYLDSAVLGYTGYTSEYWESVVSWMERRHNWKVDAAEIVCTPGIVLALHYAVNAYAKPGKVSLS